VSCLGWCGCCILVSSQWARQPLPQQERASCPTPARSDASPAPSPQPGPQPRTELWGDGKRAWGTETSPSSPPPCAQGCRSPGGHTAHHTLPPPSHPHLLLPFQHICVQQITDLVSMETPSCPPHLCNSVGLAWQQRVRVSCYPIPAREPPPGVHQSPSDPSSRSSQGSPAVRQPRLEGGLLLPAKSARPTSLLQAGWSSKAALAPRLSPLLGFAGSALTVPHAPPLPPSARQPPRSSKCQEPSTGANPGRGPCRGAESQRHPKSAKVPTRPGCQ